MIYYLSPICKYSVKTHETHETCHEMFNMLKTGNKILIEIHESQNYFK